MILEHMFPLRESRKNKQAFRERLQTVGPRVVPGRLRIPDDVNDIANDTDKQSPATFSGEGLFYGAVCKTSAVCMYL